MNKKVLESLFTSLYGTKFMSPNSNNDTFFLAIFNKFLAKPV